MNSTYKMFAVNEKIILYILFLIVLQFFFIFSQLPCIQISIDLSRHVMGGKVPISTCPSLWWELY